MKRPCFLVAALLALCAFARAEDGYRLWLRYDRIADESLRQSYAAAFTELVVPEVPPSRWNSGTVNAARDELVAGLRGLLATDVPVVAQPSREGALVLGVATRDPAMAGLVGEADLRAAGEEGYVLRELSVGGRRQTLLLANRDIGLVYGAFALLRHLQTQQPVQGLNLVSGPRIQRRMLNHWDNLRGFVERGYAGDSLWRWFELPDVVSPRYRDYARANASIGINGAVLNNVNADALSFTHEYLVKAAALAKVFRPYGIRVYLSVRFSTPNDLGELQTGDPLDPKVIAWWRAKVEEIYALIPDFGGFLVKANSEGEPGPQDYGRTHLDGANLLADALVPHGGIVMWRAFVYQSGLPEDRAKQAYNQFKPDDGRFRANAMVQVKNGPIDFMPREPFHPLFGAMPRTPLAVELQITQEYLGGAMQLAFLAPMWKEVLDSDTHAQGPGSTVARVVDGSLELHGLTGIAGVSNVGDDRNWTGHPLAAANWYAFGRLSWDHALTSAQIADEWTRMTFTNEARVRDPIVSMLLASHEAVVDYSMPLGLHHIMAEGHHYGPGPWVDKLKRPEWTSVYYHRADAVGLGFDRTASGSDALSQYAPEVAKLWGELATCPDRYLLWFHHVPWDHRMRSGRTLWDELCLRYQHGVETVRGWQRDWAALQGSVDAERFADVTARLARQEHDAREWRDACIQYFQTFSKRPVPAGVEPPAHPLDFYVRRVQRYMPGSADAAGR